MADLPTALAYYGSFQGAMQILKHQSLPLFQADELRDPFLSNKFTPLGFDCQTLFERSVKSMSSAILGKEAPKGNSNHPLQKAISRWRGENRFSDESEIRESLITLLPAMVEKIFKDAEVIHANWQSYISAKRVLPFFEVSTDADLWLLEADRFTGVVIKFKCSDDSLFKQSFPVNYSKKPTKPIEIQDCVDLMMGNINEINIDYQQVLLSQNYQYRKQKEWRLIVDKEEDNNLCLDFPKGLIQSIYIGALVPKLKSEQLVLMARQLNSKINLYQAQCSETSFDFQYEKL